MVEPTNIPERFNETAVIMDDQTWIWQMVSSTMTRLGLGHVRLPTTVPLRHSWERMRRVKHMIILWESKNRSGGAIIEEIIGIQPNFDVGARVIILTTDPTHEDVVYFSELGVRHIVRVRNREKDLAVAARELEGHLTTSERRDKTEDVCRRLQLMCDTLSDEPPMESIVYLEESLAKLHEHANTARVLDLKGKLHMFRREDAEAVAAWHLALEKNPNFFHAYNSLIDFYRRRKKYHDAFALMQKMHELNRQNTSRLVGMAEVHMDLNDHNRAESCFKSALERDAYCSGALNGLAEIRFHRGDLEEARRLLARSQTVYKTAANLNRAGIELVRKGKFQEALDHYTRAQYVLPQQDKGPLLFYNIALCYARWGRFQMAREFLKIALIKEPEYKKALKLMSQVEAKMPVAPKAA